MNIGQVYFNKRDIHSRKRVANGDAGMGESGWVDQNEVDAFAFGIVYAIDELILGIALQGLQVMPLVHTALGERLIDVGQSSGAIDFRFAGAEQVQVWSVEYQDCCHSFTFGRAAFRNSNKRLNLQVLCRYLLPFVVKLLKMAVFSLDSRGVCRKMTGESTVMRDFVTLAELRYMFDEVH